VPIVTNQTPFTLTKLATELTTDPINMGYGVSGPNPQSSVLAALINQTPEPAGVTGGIEQIFKAKIPTRELLNGWVKADFTAMAAVDRELVQIVFSQEEVDTGNATFRTLMNALFPTSTTRTNMIAASSRNASRAEALWGDGTTVTAEQVAQALGR
jgi:hypothetical protein